MSQWATTLSGWRSGLAMAAASLALAACGTLGHKAPAPTVAPAPSVEAAPQPPRPAPPPAPAPARVSCVPKAFPHAPKYPDTDEALLAAGGAADRYQLMAAGRLLRARRLAELEHVIDGCR
ncbi:MAG: hypothetical protein ACJ798_00815 [Phenylobacterium sp.]